MKPSREIISPDGNKIFRQYILPGVTIWSVELAPGTRHYIEPAQPGDGFFAILFLSGSWRLHNSGKESGPEDLGWHQRNPDGSWPQSWWSEYHADDYCEAGPNGVKWLCFQRN